MNENNSFHNKKDTRPVWVRVIAMIVVIILIAMIIATLICAFSGTEKKTVLGLLICDMIIPIFIWVFLKVTKNLSDMSDKRKEADNE